MNLMYSTNTGPLTLLCFPFLCCDGRLYNAYVFYEQIFCHDDHILDGIAPYDTWTATSRGLCTVSEIIADLTLPDDSQLTCTQYRSLGTTYSEFSVIMGGVDGCCVKSSHQDQVCE